MGALCFSDRLSEIKMEGSRDFFSVKNVYLTRGNLLQLFQQRAEVKVERLTDERIEVIKEHLVYEGIYKRTADWERKQQKKAPQTSSRVVKKTSKRKSRKKNRNPIKEEPEKNCAARVGKARKEKAESGTPGSSKDDAADDTVSLHVVPKRSLAVLEVDKDHNSKKTKLEAATNGAALVCTGRREELTPTVVAETETLPLSVNNAEASISGIPPRDLTESKRPQTIPCEWLPLVVIQPLLPKAQAEPQGAASLPQKSVPQPDGSRQKVSVPQPVASLKQLSVPQPVATLKQLSVPQPVAMRQQVSVAQPVASLQQVPVPQPDAMRQKVSVPQPDNSRQKVSVPQPDAMRQQVSMPQPVASLKQLSVPQPVATLKQLSVPQPVATHQQVSMPQPVAMRQQVSVAQPVASLQQVPVPQPDAMRQKVSVPQPDDSHQKVSVPQPDAMRQQVSVPQPVASLKQLSVPQPVATHQEVPMPQPVAMRQQVSVAQPVASLQQVSEPPRDAALPIIPLSQPVATLPKMSMPQPDASLKQVCVPQPVATLQQVSVPQPVTSLQQVRAPSRAAALSVIPVAPITATPPNISVLPNSGSISQTTVPVPPASLPATSIAVAAPIARIEQPLLTEIKTEPGIVVEKRAPPSVPLVVIPAGRISTTCLKPITNTAQKEVPSVAPPVVDPVGNPPALQNNAQVIPRAPMIRVRDPASLGIVSRRFSQENSLQTPPTTNATVVTPAVCSDGPQSESSTALSGAPRRHTPVDLAPNASGRAPNDSVCSDGPQSESSTALSGAPRRHTPVDLAPNARGRAPNDVRQPSYPPVALPISSTAQVGIVSRRFSQENSLQTPSTTNATVVTTAVCSDGPQSESSTALSGAPRRHTPVDLPPNARGRVPNDLQQHSYPPLAVPISSAAQVTLIPMLESGRFDMATLPASLPSFTLVATEIHRIASFLCHLWEQLLNLTHNKDLDAVTDGGLMRVPSFVKACFELNQYLDARRSVFRLAMAKLAQKITFERAFVYVSARVRFLRLKQTGNEKSYSHTQFLQVYHLVNNNNPQQVSQPLASLFPAFSTAVQLSRGEAGPVSLTSHKTPVLSNVPGGDVPNGNGYHLAGSTTVPIYQPSSAGATPIPAAISLASGYHVRVVNSRRHLSDPTTTDYGNTGQATTIGSSASAPTPTTSAKNVFHASLPVTANGYHANRASVTFGTASVTGSSTQSNLVSNSGFSVQIPFTAACEKVATTDSGLSVPIAVTTKGYSRYSAANINGNATSTSVSGNQRNHLPCNEPSGNSSNKSGRFPSTTIANAASTSSTVPNGGYSVNAPSKEGYSSNAATTSSNIGHSFHVPVAVNIFHTYLPPNGNGNIGSRSAIGGQSNTMASNMLSTVGSSGTGGVYYSTNINHGGISMVNTTFSTGYPTHPVLHDNRGVVSARVSNGEKQDAGSSTVQAYSNHSRKSMDKPGSADHSSSRDATNGYHLIPAANGYQGTGTGIRPGNQESSVRYSDNVSGQGHGNNVLSNLYNANQSGSNGPSPASVQHSVISANQLFQANQSTKKAHLNVSVASHNSLGNRVCIDTSQTLAPVAPQTSIRHPGIGDKGRVGNLPGFQNDSTLRIRAQSSDANGTTAYLDIFHSGITKALDGNGVRTIQSISNDPRSKLAVTNDLSPSLPTSNSDPVHACQTVVNGSQQLSAIFNHTSVTNGENTQSNPNLSSSATAVNSGSAQPHSADNFLASEALTEIAAKQGCQAERRNEKQPTNGDRQRPVLTQSQEMNVDKVAAAPYRAYAARKRQPAHVLQQRIDELSRKKEASTVSLPHVVIGKQGATIVEPTKRSYRNDSKFHKRNTASWMRPAKGTVLSEEKAQDVVAAQNGSKEVVVTQNDGNGMVAAQHVHIEVVAAQNSCKVVVAAQDVRKKVVANGEAASRSSKEAGATLPENVVQTLAGPTENSRETVIRNNKNPEKSTTSDLENCVDCGKRAVGLCGACKSVAYCSNECMTTHWIRLHNIECKPN